MKNKKNVILALVVLALAGVLVTKLLLKTPFASSVKQAVDSTGPAIYLFLNEKDQDAGCRNIYSLFESNKKSLPPEVKTARLDINADQTLFETFDVRILPTILFVNKKGEIKHKIEGEGDEVTEKIKDAFSNTGTILGL